MSSLTNYRTEPLSPLYNKIKLRYTKNIYMLLREYLQPEAMILEIGPGHGHFARYTRGVGHSYDAIEPSDYFRKALLRQGIQVTAEAIPPVQRDSDRYDLVHASMLIENLPSSYEAGEFACEVSRVLKPYGLFCLIFPNYLTWGRFFFDEHYTHSFETTPRRVSHLLTSQGFEILRIEHTLGWFWVKESIFKNIIRHISNVGMWFFHLSAVRWTFEYLGLSELHWKVRKTFFEAIIVVARKKAHE